MATADGIILKALRLLNVKESGESLSGAEAADGLVDLNDLLDSFANEKLMLPEITERTHTLVASDGSYTIGSGADINTTWPVKIESAFIRDSNGQDYHMQYMNDEQYGRIHLKTTETTYPTHYYYNRAYPTGTIYLWPEPSTAYTLHLRVWSQFTAFASGSTSASLPPGYERMLKYNLAVEMAPEYKEPSPLVIKTAIESKAAIKRVNLDVPIMRSPMRFIGRRGNNYNIYQGY